MFGRIITRIREALRGRRPITAPIEDDCSDMEISVNDQQVFCDYVPCGGGSHTSFMMFLVANEGLRPIPASNFRVITPAARAKIIAELEKHNLKLDQEFVPA